MNRIFYPLLALIASATDLELARYVEFLKTENQILRSRIKGQIHTRPHEREKLVSLGKKIGRAVEELITIVHPSNFYRWLKEKESKANKNPKGGKRKPRQIRELVIQIAKTTGFGYTRIIGELRKLGIKKISRQTVRNILKEEGIQPGPDRSTDTWENFIQRHGETLWAVDFFSVRSITAKGFQHLYVMVFLCMKTREIIVSPSTQHPNSAWVKQQTEMFLNETAGRTEKPAIVMHDRDTKFTTEFVAALEARSVRANALPKASPNLNGRCERVIQTLKLECLWKFLIFGQRHLDHILREFTEYYNRLRSHTERDHLPPIHSRPDEVPILESEQIVVKSYVGGLVKSFERKVA